MEYKLIGKNNYFDPIKTVLENRGIVDIQSYLHINEKVVIHWSKLKNIEKAINCFLKHVKNNSKIFIQVDGDADGYTSAALLISYLKKVFPNIQIIWRLHDGKEHGIFIDTIPDDVQLVIIPDAGSNQIDEHRQLIEKGIDTIVLDHHECNKESEYAIVVNSQLSPEYENKQLSGVGIVYKFCKGLDEILNINLADDFLDLVAIGNIADTQDMRSLETRYYVNKGLNNINNKLLKALFEKQSYSTKGVVNINNVEYYIAPLINACIRVGTMEEKSQMMRSLLETDEKIYYKRKNIYEPIEVNTARMLVNIKQRQNRMRDKGVVLIKDKIKEKNLLQNKLLIVDVTDILDKNLIGLVANGLKDEYKRGTILVRYNKEKNTMTGSLRGYDKGSIKDLKTFLQSLNKFDLIEGHPNAAGLEISPEKLVEANEMINEILKNELINTTIHEVDFIIPSNQLKKQFITEINKYKYLWGHNVEEPLIAIKDIEINSNEIYLNGKNKNTIKFIHKDIEFIKFRSNEDEWSSIINKGERLVLDIVGKCATNEYGGKKTLQIIIEDLAVTNTKKKQFIF